MSILVTGCCGFIGSHLCEAFLKLNKNVIGIDNISIDDDQVRKEFNLEILQDHSNFTFVHDDICMSNVVEKYKPFIVIHLAGLAGVRKSLEIPEKYIHNNVFGHTYLLKQSIKHNVSKFIYASSSSVYGNRSSQDAFSESDALDKVESPYALSKLTCENITEILAKTTKMQCVGVRFFSVYGPRGRPDMAPYKFCDAMLKGKPVELNGSGNQKRDYTYIDDVVESLMRMVNHTKQISGIYNIGYGSPVSIKTLIEYLEEFTELKAKISQKPVSSMDVEITFCNNSKFKNEFDFAPQVNFRKGLEKMVQWMVKQHRNEIHLPK